MEFCNQVVEDGYHNLGIELYMILVVNPLEMKALFNQTGTNFHFTNCVMPQILWQALLAFHECHGTDLSETLTNCNLSDFQLGHCPSQCVHCITEAGRQFKLAIKIHKDRRANI